jgi:hypothetical protein
MAIDLAQIKADMAGICKTENPVTVAFAGGAVSGFRSDISRDKLINMPGYIDSYAFSVRFYASDLTAPVPQDATATIGGVTYRVIGTLSDPFGATIRCDFGAQYG